MLIFNFEHNVCHIWKVGGVGILYEFLLVLYRISSLARISGNSSRKSRLTLMLSTTTGK